MTSKKLDASKPIWQVAVIISANSVLGCSLGHWLGLLACMKLNLAPPYPFLMAAVAAWLTHLMLLLLPVIKNAKVTREALAAIWMGESWTVAAIELVLGGVFFGLTKVFDEMESGLWIAAFVSSLFAVLISLPISLMRLTGDVIAQHRKSLGARYH